jgi:hypothetical protein
VLFIQKEHVQMLGGEPLEDAADVAPQARIVEVEQSAYYVLALARYDSSAGSSNFPANGRLTGSAVDCRI